MRWLRHFIHKAVAKVCVFFSFSVQTCDRTDMKRILDKSIRYEILNNIQM